MQHIQGLAARVAENIGRVIIGKGDVVQLMVAALVAGGHVLLEDVPGTGKTVLAKALAKSLSLSFARIQFTPDLLPADVTGTSLYDMGAGRFTFQPGPVFTHILLADEINRATPRTQAALLECMEERQVTEGGETRPLPPPFLVLATQNPVEIQGTFPLPEAQLDRFLLRLSMGYPTTAEAGQLLSRFIREDPLSALEPVATLEDILSAQRAFQKAHVSDGVRDYIIALCERTRTMENVHLGVSPRGMLALLRASQALACVRGRDFVTPDDVKALALPVMGHRIIMSGAFGQQSAAQTVVEKVLHSVPVPTEADR